MARTRSRLGEGRGSISAGSFSCRMASQQQLDVAMRQGAFDEEELVGVDQGFVLEHAPEALDLVLGPSG